MRAAAAIVLALVVGCAGAADARRAAPACGAKRAASGNRAVTPPRAAVRRACAARRGRIGRLRGGTGSAPAAWRSAPTLGGQRAPGGAAPAGAPAGAPTATPTPAPGYTPPPAPADDPHAVRVSSTEFALTLSRTAVSAGQVRVEFDNSRAEDPHDLVIDPDGSGDLVYLGQLGPGEVSAKTVDLPAGTYTLFCSLADHEQLGMQAKLTAS